MKKKKKFEPILSYKDKRFRSALISVLRRFSRFWEPSNNVLKNSRIGRGMYQCKICCKIVTTKEIKVDHIDPVVPVTGFTTWDDLIARLFCEESGLQALCKVCHDKKTKEENDQRRRCMKEKAVIQYYKSKIKEDD